MREQFSPCIRRASAGLFGAMLLAAGSGVASTFTVSNTNDSANGSLRQAILDANASPGADTIAFSIPGDGIHTIMVVTPLPPLTDDAGATIDGYSQPGSSPNTLLVGSDAVLRIELRGMPFGRPAFGLTLQSSANLVRGLVMNGFAEIGAGAISVQHGSDNVVTGCFLGTDATGSSAIPNEFGVVVSGEYLLPPATPPLGTRIGGTTPGERNVISGNASVGISIFVTGGGNAVVGNYIGTNADGGVAVGNGTGLGVTVSGGTRIGGTGPGSQNVISGNLAGIIVFASNDDVIEGNRIGTDATGLLPLPNAAGIQLVLASGTVVGGSAPGAGNVISANSLNGVRLFNCLGVLIAGNLIGTAGDGAAPLGNGQNGVRFIAGPSTGNSVGGSSPGEGNVIAFNGAAGVANGGDPTDATQGIRVLYNSIHDNGELGIDLGGDGVTANDPGDADTGPNDLQNFPALTGALVSVVNGKIVLRASQDSRPASGGNELQFFLADGDPSGHGEGRTLLLDQPGLPAGFFTFTTPAITPASPVLAGDLLTATATTADGTSEFSQNLPFVANRAPVANAGANQSVLIGSNVTLNGSGSLDPDGLPNGASIAEGSFHWTQTAGPAVTLLNPGNAAPSFTAGAVGTLVFSLVVSDGLDVSANPATVTVDVPGRVTALGPAMIWVGLRNSDDVGTRFDLMAEVLRNSLVVGSAQVENVPGGGSGFGGAILNTIPLTLAAPLVLSPGDTLGIRLSVRVATAGHRSGTARLWFSEAATSRFAISDGAASVSFYLLDAFSLGTSPGPAPKKTIDVFVDRAAGGNPFKPFGTWSRKF